LEEPVTQSSEQELRATIVEIGRCVWQKGWVASNDGNISCRLDANRVLCTPTGVSKGMMKGDDLIICDMDGTKIAGHRQRTSELHMHLLIYRMRPDVQAVVHAHPPGATGFAVAGRALNLAILPEVIVTLGCVPLAEYGLPGTPALTEGMLPLIPKYDAILMGNHGAVCYGDDLWKAYFRMETVEHTARITLIAEMLGGARVLPRQEVDKLLDSRSRYGVSTKAGFDAGCPQAADDLTGSAACDVGEARYEFTRSELIGLIKEALRMRGVDAN
jgi:L-fuculose-phosphate aldolase